MIEMGLEPMKILVTGASGHLGANLIRQLAEQGYEVLGLLNPEEGPDEELELYLSRVHDRITYLRADVRAGQDLDELLARHRPTHLVHLAAVTEVDPDEPGSLDRMFEVNVRGTLNVLQAATASEIRRMIYLSSAAVYDHTAETLPIKEDHRLIPQGFYGLTKATAENLCEFYRADLQALEVIRVRLGFLFGPFERPIAGSRQGRSLVYQMVRLALAGKPLRLAHLDHVRDWIHVYDAARAVQLLLTARGLSEQVYNLAAGRPYSHRQLLEALAGALPVDYEQVEEGQVNIPLAATEKRRGPLDISRLIQETGFAPRLNLETSLRQYVNWVQEQAGGWSRSG